MKLFYKLAILMVIISTLFTNIADAKSLSKIDKIIKASGLEDSAVIAISVREADSKDIVYERDEKKLLHPASTLKLFSTTAALDTLARNYTFKTSFYKDNNNNLYVKLGADPLLTADKLKDLVKELRGQNLKSFNNIFVDDSIFDRQEWGIGWMWDDDTNPLIPKFSAYNLDNNIIKLSVSKAQNGDVSIVPSSKYPMSVVNCLEIASDTKYNLFRYNWVNPEIVEINGVVSANRTINLPISSMRRYFIYTLTELFKNYNIKFANMSYVSKMIPADATKIAEVSSSVLNVLPSILQDSNNKNAETLSKVAASELYSTTGTSQLQIRLFNEYWNKQGVNTKDILIADASGVSRNNLISVDWMTRALSALYDSYLFETIKDSMAQPGDGTLSTRLFDLRGDVWLKTGSLSNISGITGFVTDKKGNTYVVAILIQNFNCDSKEIKSLEDKIITLIYE